ncbi:MlaC/ttg2D family ABC transporter substrate-binding protein [Massilia horti]|uniref:ABC transporter substrate-binding protein n=1 Tax=Massilia horti TaxID=2562153 RepID=A0A4Y9SNH0_9BURK|nr:ABC transporter substrate-binding protein [Massilia horti]TFW28001.1 ABC transporter substrate-binding protein [Massilia horti]
MRLSIWAPVAVLVAAPHVYAQQAESRNPGEVVKSTVEGVMNTIRTDPVANSGDMGRIYGIVEQKFIPNTDFRYTTQLAVGPAWEKATPAQRDELFKQFQTLLAHTYATQLAQSRGQQTQFKYPPSAPLKPGATDVVVRTQVVTGGDVMPIDYRLHKTDAGWKIYDINMMGAWMIQVYRQQFAGQLAKGGIDGLIKFITAHNQANV